MLVSNAPQSGADPALDAVLFDVGGRSVRRSLVRTWAHAHDPAFTGRLTERARLGAGEVDDEPTIDALVEADAAEFRYARDLESSDDLVTWLETRGLTVDGWWESFRRNVLERRAAEGRDVLPPSVGVSDEVDEEEVRRADLVVTDLLAGATQALAARLAVAHGTRQWTLPAEGDAPALRDERLARAFIELEAIWTPWREAALTTAALQQAVERERLAWLVLEVVQTVWPSGDSAREAVSCVRFDGMTLAALAEEAGTTARAETLLLADVPEALHDALLVAAPGELVGPVPVDARWYVIEVVSKRPPVLDEPRVSAAATRAVVSRASAAAVARHIVWREFRP